MSRQEGVKIFLTWQIIIETLDEGTRFYVFILSLSPALVVFCRHDFPLIRAICRALAYSMYAVIDANLTSPALSSSSQSPCPASSMLLPFPPPFLPHFLNLVPLASLASPAVPSLPALSDLSSLHRFYFWLCQSRE